MTTPKNCVFCATTNRLIDFIADGSDGNATISKFTSEYGPALIILPVDEAWTRGLASGGAGIRPPAKGVCLAGNGCVRTNWGNAPDV